MATAKVMKLDKTTGVMECKVCGQRVKPRLQEGGKLPRGAWHCPSGCKLGASKASGAK